MEGIAVTLRLTIIALLLTTLTASAWTQQQLMRRAYGARGAVVSAWTPSNATAVVAWYDASDSATLLCTNTTSVTNWLDKSASGLTLASTTAGSRPAVTNGIFGSLNSIYFNGNNWLIRNTTLVAQGQSNVVIFIVAKQKTSPGTITLPFCIANPALTVRSAIGWVTTNTVQAVGRRLDADAAQSSYVTNASLTSAVMLVASFNYAQSNLLVRVNGSQEGAKYNFQTPGTSQNTAASLSAGAGYNGLSLWFTGWIAEIIVTHSTNDISNIETYLRNKWGTP